MNPTTLPHHHRNPCRTAFLLLGLLLATGCTIHRVGSVTTETRRPIPLDSVRVAPKPGHGHRPAGMLSLKIMPILRNTPETRAALAKQCAAELGYDTVGGLLDLEEVYAKWPLGVALLADSTQPPPASRPKFTVCMPLPAGPAGKMGEAAARYLRQEIQYVAAEKGYYVYFTEVPGITLTSLRNGSADLAPLAEPLGAAPDFVLLAELTQLKRSGSELLMASQEIEVALHLVDVDARQSTWTRTMKGAMVEGLIFPGIGFSLATSHDEDLREATRNTVLPALETLPPVPLYRKLK